MDDQLDKCSNSLMQCIDADKMGDKISYRHIRDSGTGKLKALSIILPKNCIKNGAYFHEITQFMCGENEIETIILRLELNNGDPYLQASAKIADKVGFMGFLEEKVDLEGNRIYRGLAYLAKRLFAENQKIGVSVHLTDDSNPKHFKLTFIEFSINCIE